MERGHGCGKMRISAGIPQHSVRGGGHRSPDQVSVYEGAAEVQSGQAESAEGDQEHVLLKAGSGALEIFAQDRDPGRGAL